ncbi:hypothetical protein Daus18300_008413 [Diaporthe australafricana]|uniref:WD40 repeat-like protein n=1 Tax=Diaporthe australafricana TaxID=127596 RepID=A0ABR3WI16_9PEZI
MRAAFEQSLAAGTTWCSGSTLNHQIGSSASTEELHKAQQLNTKVTTASTIEELTRSSSNRMAEVFRITALDGTQPGCHQLVFSPDSKTLAVTSIGDSVGLWSIEKRALVRTVENFGKYATFSPDSRQVAAVTNKGAACIVEASLDRYSEGPRLSLRGLAEEARCIAFSPSGDQMVVGTSKGALMIWNPKTGKSVKKIKSHAESVLWVAYYSATPRDKVCDIVAAGADGWFRFWELQTRSILPDRWTPVENWLAKGKHKKGLNVLGRISAAAASKSFGRLAVANLDGTITVWYNKEGRHWINGLERESVLQGHNKKSRIHTMEFSPDSKLLVSASNNSFKIWQVRGGLPVAVVSCPGGGILRSVAFSPDSASLASTSSDGSINLWDAEDLQNLGVIQDHLDRASFVAVSTDRRYTASVVRELRSKTPGRNSFSLSDTVLKQRQPVDTDIATLMIWDVAHAKPLILMSGHEAEILSVSFSEDSRRLGSISSDHVLRIWEVETSKCLNTVISRTNAKDTMPCAAISTGLRYCAAVFRFQSPLSPDSHSGFAVSLCDVRPGSQASTGSYPCIALTGTAVEDDILAITFSPDATKLAAVDQNGNVTLWDTASGSMTARLSDFADPAPPDWHSPFAPEMYSTRHFATYRAHISHVGSPALQFTSSGTRLVVSSGLGVARLWDMEEGGKLLCRIGDGSDDFRLIKMMRQGRDEKSDDNCFESGEVSSAFTYCSYSTPLVASPDGSRCVASYQYPRSSGPRYLTLWDTSTAAPIALLAEHASMDDLRHVSFSPDSQWLVTASAKAIMVRDAATGRRVAARITGGLSWPLRMVAFWPDSKYVVSGCHKGMLQFCDFDRVAMVKAFEGHTGPSRYAL